MPKWAYRALFAAGVAVLGVASLAGLTHELRAHHRLPPVEYEARLAKSVRDFQEFATLQPRNPAVLLALGDALVRAGRLGEATRAYERLLAFYPVPAEAHTRLAGLYLRSGRPRLARQQARLALRRGEHLDPALLRTLGVGEVPPR